MTRAEAIEIEKKKLSRLCTLTIDIDRIATANIDALIELGVLKVSKSLSPMERLAIHIGHPQRFDNFYVKVFDYLDVMLVDKPK